MNSFGVCICFAVVLAVALAQRGNFRQFNNNPQNFQNFNNNNNNNNNNFRPANNNQNFRQFNNNNNNFNQNNNNNNNFRQFNNNNNNNNNFQQFQPQRQSQPIVEQRPTQNFDFGLDTSDGRFAKFNGPVKGLPHGHGGGRYGAADCLLCPQGF